MGMVHAYQKGELAHVPPSVKRVARTMNPDDTLHFATTKHEGLPEKKSAMKNSTILERAGLLMQVAKEAQAGSPDMQQLMDTLKTMPRASAASQIAGMLAVPALTGGVRTLMETPADKEKHRGHLERFGRGAVYGAAVPAGAELGAALGGGAGMGLGAAAGTPGGPGGIASGAILGGGTGALAGGAAGGVGTYKLLKSLLGD